MAEFLKKYLTVSMSKQSKLMLELNKVVRILKFQKAEFAELN